MLEISNNSINIYRSCPKKYYWRYLAGLTPYKKSTALTLGSIVHNAFDMYYKKFSLEEILKYIIDTADNEISKAEPSIAEDLVVMKYTAIGMWLNCPKDISIFSDIQPELYIEVDLDSDTKLVLRVDGIVKIDGKLWIRELKTTGMSFSQFEQRCETSPQCSTYTYAVRKHGLPVEGVIFDFIKKPLLRRHIKETKEQFGKRISLDYKARPDFYYKRHYSYRNQETLDLYSDDLEMTINELRRRKEDNAWYRNTDNCWNYNTACPYMPICFQKNPDSLTIELFFMKGETHGKENGDKTRC